MKPVIEYGNAMITHITRDGMIDLATQQMIQHQIDEATSHLKWISDLEWIEPPHLVKGPSPDALRRWQPWGWYGKFASEGYGELRKHFACRLPHIPNRVTLRWALRLWWNNRKDWR